MSFPSPFVLLLAFGGRACSADDGADDDAHDLGVAGGRTDCDGVVVLFCVGQQSLDVGTVLLRPAVGDGTACCQVLAFLGVLSVTTSVIYQIASLQGFPLPTSSFERYCSTVPPCSLYHSSQLKSTRLIRSSRNGTSAIGQSSNNRNASGIPANAENPAPKKTVAIYTRCLLCLLSSSI